jgi:PAP2 superfamily
MKPLQSAILCAVLATGAPLAQADVVTDWNAAGLRATNYLAGFNGFQQARIMAFTHAAIFDTVNAIDRRYAPYAVDLKAPVGASIDAAVAAAAHTVLVKLAPGQKGALDAALAATLAKVPKGSAKADGLALGTEVAERFLASRANDGHDKAVEVNTPAPTTGVWQQTPGFGAPIFTNWIHVRPMALKTLTQFDGGGPYKLDDRKWVQDYNEIKSVGARNSTTRTADQTAAAIYWTVQTMTPWNVAAQAASKAKNLNVTENARLFALLNIAAHDTQVVGNEQKYRYNFWRPYTATRFESGPGNPALASDPNWEPLCNTPGNPEYPSGHAITSGAAERVLRAFFNDDRVNVSNTHIPGVGVTRSWTSFSHMLEEVTNARVWAGIHFRTSVQYGAATGAKVGDYVMKNQLQPLAKMAGN